MPNSKARKDRDWKKHLRELSKRENPIHSTMCLPPDVNLDDIQWTPSRVEQLFSWLEADKKAAVDQEMAYLRRKAAEFAEDVQRDKERGLL